MVIATNEKPIGVTRKRIGKAEVDIWYGDNKTINHSCPPKVMVHGMFGGGWYFENWARYLREKGLLAYVIKDLHEGEDLRKVDFYTYVEKTIKVVEEICNETDSKIILCGHSMGGLIAQEIAAKKPDLVAGLVLVASAPPKGISTMSWSVAKAMAKHLFSLVFNLPLKIDKKSALNLLFNWLGDEERKEQLFQKLVPESSKIAKQLAFSRIPVDETRVFCKTLVVAGAYDKLLPIETQVKIADKYDAEGRTFLNGHMMMLEDRRNEIIGAIHGWINLNLIY